MFLARLATAAVLLAACIGAMFVLPPLWWSLLLLAVLLAAGYEWGTLAGYGSGARGLFCCVLLLSAVSILLAVPVGEAAGLPPAERAIYGASCVFWLLVVPVWLARGWRFSGPFTAAVVGWLALVPTWLALARLQADPVQLLLLLGIVWLADSAAYGAGRAWGRHKLAPRISPGKTWEGVGGAVAAVAVYYVVLSAVAPAQTWAGGWTGALIFAGVTVMSIVGDLFESHLKRQAGVKDSGSLLPGHGGVLDRIDGLLCALPLAALLVRH